MYFIFFKNNSSLTGAGFFYYRYTAFQSCAFRVHFVCITPVFCAHGTANFHLKLLSVCNRKACISVFSSKYRLFNSGGQRGIRTFITFIISHIQLLFLFMFVLIRLDTCHCIRFEDKVLEQPVAA